MLANSALICGKYISLHVHIFYFKSTILDISSLGNKKNQYNHSQQGDIFYIADGCNLYKRSIFANPFAPRIHGSTLAIEDANEWAVLSVPGGRFSHVGDAIGQVVSRDFLGRENPNAIVLMCGTNELVSVDSQSWKENFQQLLHRCQYLFPQVPTYAIALLPRCDGLRHLVPHNDCNGRGVC